jgi:hypothetical protein
MVSVLIVGSSSLQSGPFVLVVLNDGPGGVHDGAYTTDVL